MIGPSDVIALHDGTVLEVHPRERCVPPCAVHAPSDHPLRDAEQRWLPGLRALMRMCEHEIVHPDPDDLSMRRQFVRILLLNAHEDCDGCCQLER